MENKNECLLNDQYNRVLDHLHSESTEWLWYHNFFFGANILFFVAVSNKDFREPLLLPGIIFMFLISIVWLFVAQKQKSWLDRWIEIIKSLEKELHIPKDFILYDHENKEGRVFNFKIGKITWWLLTIPKFYVLLYFTLIIIRFGCYLKPIIYITSL